MIHYILKFILRQKTIFKQLILFILLYSFFYSCAQDKRRYKIHTVAFYNLENLFDTINDPLKNDEASPIMHIALNNRGKVYKKKIKNMARVITDIGFDTAKNAPAIIGLAEIENRSVLEDLANSPQLLEKNYGIVHFDSPDRRGIDVALMYRKNLFTPTDTKPFKLDIYDPKSSKKIYTRDQLLVSGFLEGELIHIIVNHWPSRRGGEAKSRPKRIAASKLCKSITDSLHAKNPYSKIIIMGDFNDNPTNFSIKSILNVKNASSITPLKGLYNPYEKMFTKEGWGTTAHRDNFNLFDQVITSKALLGNAYDTFKFWKAGIYNKLYLLNKRGRYKGYPYRSFSRSGFTNGFSDHFPVFVYLIKEVKD